MLLDHMIPEEGGGGVRNQPGSSENRRHDVRWNLIMNRYGKPVLSPNYRPDIPGSGRPVRKESLDRSVRVAHTSRSGTRLDQVGRVRVGQPRRPLVRGVGVTSADSTEANRGRSVVAEGTTVTDTLDNTVPARYNIPNDVSGDGDWHRVVTRNGYVKPMRTQDYRMGVSEMDDFETYGTTQMVVADDPVCVIKPDGDPAELLAEGGLQSDNNMDSHVRCLNCHNRKRQYGTMGNSGHVRKPLSKRLRPWSGRSPTIVNRSPPIVTQRIPPEVMETMHHEWILRKSVTNTDMTVPCNYLEIPDPMLPNAFLHLAEEAREVVLIKEPSGFFEEVQSRATRLSSPPLVEVLTNGHQIPFGRGSLTAVVRPGLADRERQTASAESEGLDASWHERADGRVTAPVIPVGRDVHRRRRNEPVDRSCPVDIHILSEPSVRFGHRTERLDDTVVGPEGQEGCLGAPDIGSPRYDSTGSGHRIDEPVFTETRVYTNTGPLGFIVELGGCITNWPDPVGPSGEMEQSVFAGLKADREGCIPSDRVRPGMMMFSTRPGRDVSEGPDGARRSVDHVSPSPVHDEDRQVVGGPVGRFPSSDILLTDDGSVLSEDRRDDVISRQSEVVPFTDVPRTTEHRDDRPGAVDFDGPTQTRSESGCLNGMGDPLIQKDDGFQIVRVNGSLDNGLTNSRDVGRSSDSGVHSWTEQWVNMSDNSMDGSYDDTEDLRRNISDEMSRLMFGAPPNTEDEGDSDYPGTDGSLTEMLDGCPSEAMSDRDRDMTCSEMTDSDNDRRSDIAVLSDFSDDSSILGVRKVLRCRVPYRGRAPLPRKGCAPAPRTPPVKAKNRAEQCLLEEDSTRSSWTRWCQGSLMHYTHETFVPAMRGYTDLRLRKDADPRLDRYYPKLVQSLARAGRVVRTVPRCRETHRLRRDLMLRLFDEEMEKSDLVMDRFPDRHVHKFVDRPPERHAPTVVEGTYTPPIHRKRGRKYVELKACESDAEDYFASAEQDSRWSARAVAWYEPCD